MRLIVEHLSVCYFCIVPYHLSIKLLQHDLQYNLQKEHIHIHSSSYTPQVHLLKSSPDDTEYCTVKHFCTVLPHCQRVQSTFILIKEGTTTSSALV